MQPGVVAEDVHVEDGAEVEVAVRVEAPGERPAEHQRPEADGGGLVVAVVAPVGDHVAPATVGPCRLGGVDEVARALSMRPTREFQPDVPAATQKSTPASTRGAVATSKPEKVARSTPRLPRTWATPGGDLSGLTVGGGGLVGPRHRRDPLGEGAGQVGVAGQHVGPHLDLAAVGQQRVDQPSEVLEVDRAPAPLGHLVVAHPPAELEGLVAADVDLAAADAVQLLPHQPEGEVGVVGGGGEHGGGQPDARHRRPAVGALGPGPVGVVAQPALHVAEGVLVDHQLDAVVRAVLVEPRHVGRGHGGGVLPHHAVAGVGEGVLDVELELVDAGQRAQLDQALEGGSGGDPVAADVEHEPADGDVGVVLDDEARAAHRRGSGR